MKPADLRHNLDRLGLTQKAFAEKIGVDPRTVNRWCLGEVPIPTYAIVIVNLLRERQEIAERLSQP